LRADFCLGDWIVRPRRGRIERGEEIFRIHPKAMTVLECLADADGEVVTRDELHERVWPGVIVTDDSLTQCIAELRRAFGDSAKESKVIKTIPKAGFCLVPPVETLADRKVIRLNDTRKRLTVFIATIALLAVIASWRLIDVNQPGLSNSIAVLAFVNMSDDPDNEYFSDGISEELLNLLTTIPELQVIARTSSFSFKEKDVTVAEIAHKLNVAYILEGSVRKVDDRVRVTAQLIETGTETHLWSKTYDRTLDDIFNVQNDIAKDVVESLKVPLLGETGPTVRKSDPIAYELFLRCRHFSRSGSVESLRKGESFCRQSLEIDPDYAPSWSLLSSIYHNLAVGGHVDYKKGYQKAGDFNRHALELDPNLARAHSSMGWDAMMFDRDLLAAAKHFKKALALAPNDARIIGNASVFAETLGRFDRAIELADQALALNPLSSIVYSNIAIVHCFAGQFEKASERFTVAHELYANNRFLLPWQAKCHLLQNQPEKALALAGRIELEVRRLWVLPMALYDLGELDSSNSALNQLIEKYPHEAASFIAENYAWRGEADQAFKWLNRAIDEKQYIWGSLVFDPAFRKLHADPRWAIIRAKDGRSEKLIQSIDF
jgi:TolB-like protein/DNA-binding winged helix-turn-helix (wHTH) protein/Tfp pilus assembly protein PilF